MSRFNNLLLFARWQHQSQLRYPLHQVKGKGKGRVVAVALITHELLTRSALQSRKWQLIGMS